MRCGIQTALNGSLNVSSGKEFYIAGISSKSSQGGMDWILGDVHTHEPKTRLQVPLVVLVHHSYPYSLT